VLKPLLKKILELSGYRLIPEGKIPLGVDPRLDLSRVMRHPVRRILDVGGNAGQTVRKFHALWPEASIDSFEPTPALFEKLRARCESTPRATAHNLALGASNGKLPFYCYDSGLQNSFIRNPDLPVKEELAIAVQTLDHWTAEHRIDSIDLLKIDVEGAECEVLAGAEELLRDGRIRAILAECSLYPDDRSHGSFEEIRRLLASHGFYFITFHGQFNRIDNHQFVYADALFVHRDAIRPTGKKAVMPVDHVGMK
jgi:FkbM family methyltransferase